MTRRKRWDCGIDDDTIELYALHRGPRPDPDLLAHFVPCDRYIRRMTDAVALAATIRDALSLSVPGAIRLL